MPDDRPIADVIVALDADPRVELVQPMHLFETQTTRYDDPYVELQSAAIQMDIEEAHQIATGRGVSIAIIDSAVDASHPDLRGRVRLARNLVATGQSPRSGEVHGTAVAGSDYTATSLTGVTIPAGSTAVTVTVPVTGETAIEGNETFKVMVSNVVGATVSDGAATGTIRNDDTRLSIANASVVEGNSGTKAATFTLRLSNASASP